MKDEIIIYHKENKHATWTEMKPKWKIKGSALITIQSGDNLKESKELVGKLHNLIVDYLTGYKDLKIEIK